MSDEQSSSPGQPCPLDRRWRTGDRPGPRKTGRPSPQRGKTTAIVGLVAVILLLAGSVLAWLHFIRPFEPPYFLTIPITEYTARQFPPNPFARQDSDTLMQRFAGDRCRNAFESQERAQLLKELEALKHRREAAVVLHLRAHALGRKDELFLLPGDAMPDDISTWLPFAQVLHALHQCAAKHKLLILDVMQPLADPRLGVLDNDAAERVHAMLKNHDDDGLLVLCACSPGEISLVSEEWRRSVFGYYVDKGLCGAADGYGPEGKRDGLVTAKELAGFVKVRVARWARRNRNAAQTPMLLGKGSDFPLSALDSAGVDATQAPPPADEGLAAATYPPWLLSRWKVRDQWEADETYRVAPQEFRKLEATLLHAEQRWRGGTSGGIIEPQLERDVGVCVDQAGRVKQYLGLRPPRPRTLAGTLPRNWQPDEKVAQALKSILLGLEAPPPATPEERKKAEDELNKSKKEFLEKFKGKAYAELAATVFSAAADDQAPSPSKIRFLNDLLRSPAQEAHAFPLATGGPPRYVETLYVQRVADLADMVEKQALRWPAGAVHEMLQTAREAAKATTADARTLPWIEPLLQKATTTRRQGEALLLTDQDNALGQLRIAGTQFKDINAHVEELEKAHRCLDEAMAVLPATWPYLMKRIDLGLDNAQEGNWTNTVRLTDNLFGMLLRPAPQNLPSLDELHQRILSLRRELDYLRQPFTSKEVIRLIQQAQRGDARSCLEIQAILASPLLQTKDRETLWQAGRQLNNRLNDAIMELDEAEDRDWRSIPAQANIAGLSQSIQPSPAERRARLSINLLKLGGFVGAGEPGLSRSAMLSDFPVNLQNAWARQLPKQFHAEKDLAAKDRLSRILPPFDREAQDLPYNATAAPAAVRRRQELQASWKWLYDFYQGEAALFPSPSIFHDFYEEAAQAYLGLVR